MIARVDPGATHRRRAALAAAALCLLAAVGSPAAGADGSAGLPPAPATVTREEARYMMGTVATVAAAAPDERTALAALDAAWTAFALVDARMSTWRDDSDLSRVNAGAAAAPVPAPADLLLVVTAALRLAGESGGAFDPTVLPLLRAWGLHGGPPREPGSREIAALLAATGAGRVSVDEQAGAIRFARAGMGLDLGGIAKGHALDAARTAMQSAGAVSGVLDLGGNLLVFGQGPRRVAIVAPDDPRAVVGEVVVGNVGDGTMGGGAVATSGQYERYVEVGGRRRGHILDPRTGRPVEREGSVTVVAPTGLEADALSTALFVLGPGEGATLLRRHPGVAAVFAMPRAGGGWDLLRLGAEPER